jgi:hypothetical protein
MYYDQKSNLLNANQFFKPILALMPFVDNIEQNAEYEQYILFGSLI